MIYVTVSLLFLLSTLPQSQCQLPPNKSDYYSVCRNESYNYNCGTTLTNISYPFSGQNRPSSCGADGDFSLHCDDHNTTTIQIGPQNQTFTVKEINITTYTITMVRSRTELNACSPLFDANSLSPAFVSVHDITIFYDCPSIDDGGNYFFTCGGDDSGSNHKNVTYFWGVKDKLLTEFPLLRNCAKQIQLPVKASSLPYADGGPDSVLKKILGEEFEVKYVISEECTTCFQSGGVCGTNETARPLHKFKCYCPDGSIALFCSVSAAPKTSKMNWDRKVMIGIVCVGATGLMMICIIHCLRGKSQTWWLETKNNQDIEAFLKSHGALAQKRYKFSEIKKMTNSFKVKLGQGGFGAVYKGELLTGTPVAVKILNESKEKNEDFINEVASISKTSHVNVVTLVGFCLEGHKKALIYEFMPNGSLEKFIHKKGPETVVSLSWEKLYQIAIRIARGLEYLHRGCNTRILHLDIKPHNILLDENFCPKISDFGLAKLCPKKESIISMSDPRGTPGYVAPEMWNRRYGGVSHKSDVYSYGMMLLDMVEGRKNTNAEACHTNETYFPNWIYKRLEQGDLSSDGEVMTKEENEIVKRMTIVGLWCIQTLPGDRPTMSRVIDMLEDNANSLELPPMPVLSSPIISVPESSTSSFGSGSSPFLY